MKENHPKACLVCCMDARFWPEMVRKFEQTTGLSSEEKELYLNTPPGGALCADNKGPEIAYRAGIRTFGWGAHGTGCKGLPGLTDEEIHQRLEEKIKKLQVIFPEATHYKLWGVQKDGDGVTVEMERFEK